MAPLAIVTFLLALSFSNAANFTTVYNWEHGMDYVWPSDAIRTAALNDGTFQPENIFPLYMAVHETRLFLSLYKSDGIPVTLVTIPTSNESSVSPKLTPFPSWRMHDNRNCSTIQAAKGLEVDDIGRLWVLDDGSKDCGPKLRIFNLENDAQEHVMHEFSLTYNQGYNLHDLVLDKTPMGYFAYITRKGENHIVVFSLKKKESWTVNTLGISFYSIAFSPKANNKEEAAQLYLSDYFSHGLASISVATLRNETRDASITWIGEWKARPYRMLADSNGTMYAAFYAGNHISTWKISQPFQEHSFYEVKALENSWPFSFALDSSGILWMTEHKKTWGDPEYTSRLLKVAVGSPSYIFDSTETATLTNSPSPSSTIDEFPLVSNSRGRGRENKNCDQNLVVLNVVLSCWNVFCLFSIASQILWFRKMKKMQDCIAETKKEREQMCSNPPIYNRTEPRTSEPIYEEIADPVPSTSTQTAVSDVHLQS